MSGTSDKVKGKVNEAVGKGKRGAGEAGDDPNLKNKGRGQEVKGKGQQVKGEAKDKVD